MCVSVTIQIRILVSAIPLSTALKSRFNERMTSSVSELLREIPLMNTLNHFYDMRHNVGALFLAEMSRAHGRSCKKSCSH